MFIDLLFVVIVLIFIRYQWDATSNQDMHDAFSTHGLSVRLTMTSDENRRDLIVSLFILNESNKSVNLPLHDGLASIALLHESKELASLTLDENRDTIMLNPGESLAAAGRFDAKVLPSIDKEGDRPSLPWSRSDNLPLLIRYHLNTEGTPGSELTVHLSNKTLRQ